MSPAAIEAIVILAVKYGPPAVDGIIALFKKKDATIEDVEAAFAPLKEYASYGIPELAPVKPA